MLLLEGAGKKELGWLVCAQNIVSSLRFPRFYLDYHQTSRLVTAPPALCTQQLRSCTELTQCLHALHDLLVFDF